MAPTMGRTTAIRPSTAQPKIVTGIRITVSINNANAHPRTKTTTLSSTACFAIEEITRSSALDDPDDDGDEDASQRNDIAGQPGQVGQDRQRAVLRLDRRDRLTGIIQGRLPIETASLSRGPCHDVEARFRQGTGGDPGRIDSRNITVVD